MAADLIRSLETDGCRCWMAADLIRSLETSEQVIQLNGMINGAGAGPQVRQLPEMIAE